MITACDLKAAAWFLIGEGTFGFYDRGLRVSASQVEKWPLEQLQRWFGGGIYLSKSRTPNRQDCWLWSVHGVQAAGLCMTLYGLVSPKKQAQIRSTLDSWRALRPAKKYRQACWRGHPLSGDNLRVRANGSRECRTCSNRRALRHYHGRRAAA